MRKSLRTIFFIAFFLFLLPHAFAQPFDQPHVINGSTTAAETFTGGFTYNWTNDNPSIGLPATGTGNIPPFVAINNGTSPVTAHIVATPAPTSFAYICVAKGDRGGVEVINTAQNVITTGFNLSDEPTDVEVNHAGTFVYICDHDNSNIVVVNTATNTVSANIPVISKPLSAVLSPDDSKLYVCDFPYLTVINTSNNSVITNKLGFDPGALAVSLDGSLLYISTTGGGADVGEVYVMNTTTYNETDSFVAGYNPNTISLSPDGSLLYIPNNNSLNDVDVVSTATYQIIQTYYIGQFPGRVIFSKDGQTMYETSQNQSSIAVSSTTTFANISLGGQPAGLALSADGTELYAVNYGLNVVQVISTATNQITATITGFEFPISMGNFISPLVTSSAGPESFTITVYPTPPPTIAQGIATGTISACEGSASVSPAIQQFSVSGTYLTGNITATAPAGFEISLNATVGYVNPLTLDQSSGTLNNTTIYVRSSATAPAGTHSNQISLTTQGGATQSVDVTEDIGAISIVNTPESQTLLNGAMTSAVTFSGTADTYSWTNNTPGIGLPASGTGNIPAFTAINDTFGPVTATITVTPLNNTGCDGAPVTFTITVRPTRVATITKKDIPNTFTPNGDGINDTWVINNMGFFPNATVNIFNRWGQHLFSSIGYSIPWDGTYNGKVLSSGTYYYVIDLKNGEKAIAGPLEIIK